MNLVVRELEAADEAAFLEGAKLWEGESPHWYSFCWKEGMTYPQMLEILRKDRAGLDLAPGRVPHTMLYGFLDGKIIGRVSIRHELNENLLKRGGHIGYAVAPRYRRQGFAKKMMKEAIAYCRNLGLAEIMITCDDENEPSWKIIEHFGARLQDKPWDEESETRIRRYWLTL